MGTGLDIREEGQVTRARLLRGGALFGISQFLGMALGFGSGMVLVRVADKPAVASYMLLQQAILAVGLVMQLGLGPAALRFVPICRGQGGERATALLRRRLFVIQLVLWAAVVPLLAGVWPAVAGKLDAPELAKATGFLVAAAVLSSFGNLVDSYLRSFRLYTLSAPLTHLVPRALILGGFLALLLMGRRQEPWEVLASIYLGAMLLNLLGYALALRATTAGESSEPRAAHPPPSIREILGTSTAMGLRSAASVLFVSSSLWVLSWARPHEDVAVYGVAATLLQVMAAIPSIANFVVPQEFAVLHADGRKIEMERLARTAATLVAILSAVCLAGLLLLTVGGALLNVALSLALAPRWGGYGIAAATTVTLIVLNVAMVKSARSLLGVRTFVYTRPADWRRALRLVREGAGAWRAR